MTNSLIRYSLRLVAKTLKSIVQQHRVVKATRNMSTLDEKKYIATHDGGFHCDEVAACFILKQLPDFKSHNIIRTRDENTLRSADIVVDVGGVFNSATKRFDHHQRAFRMTIKDFHSQINSTNPNKPVRLSSAGLIYAHYGKDLISEVINMKQQAFSRDIDENMLNAIYTQLYNSFIEEIDAIDNGVEIVEGDSLIYNYNLSTHLAARIRRLNPVNGSVEEQLKQFHKAMSVVGAEMVECIQELASTWWPTLQDLKKCVLDRYNVDISGAIVEVPSYAQTTWRSVILQIEDQFDIKEQIKFIIFKNPHSHKNWRIMAMPQSHRTFKSRLALKEEWRGLQDDELRKISGISDALFVHATGFTGGASSKGGCIALAKKTMNSQ